MLSGFLFEVGVSGNMGLGCDLEVDVNGEEVFLVDKVRDSVLSLLGFQNIYYYIFCFQLVACDNGLTRDFPFQFIKYLEV